MPIGPLRSQGRPVTTGSSPPQVDASDETAVAALLAEHRCDVLMNATDPRFVMPLFRAALQGGAGYLDMAMSLSKPHATDPYGSTGVKLGDEQFAMAENWSSAGQLALVGMGIEPGMADVFARYAADELFADIEELGVRDGANLVVAGYDFAPSFSIWTTIEECLNPPVIYEKERGWFTTPPFSEPEVFDFPDGHRPGRMCQCRARRSAVDAALDRRRPGDVQVRAGRGVHHRPAGAAQTRDGQHRHRSASAPAQGTVQVSPRDVIAAVLPNPALLGDRMSGKTCAGLWVKGTGKDGEPAAGLPVSRGRQ